MGWKKQLTNRGRTLAMDTTVNCDTPAAFEKRLVAFYPRLYPLALRLCGNQADAHDLVQDTVERGLRCRSMFRTGDAPDRWMYTILRRIFVDCYRSRRRRACRVAVEERLGWVAAESDQEEPSAWEAFTVEDVRRALSFVDPAARETFSLFAFADLGQDEIARRLSISRQTVATRVFRTRGKLREVLASGQYQHRGATSTRSPRQSVLRPPALQR
jgi:RNA polymerase sigma-70 factor, ECF subfamily